VKALEEEMCETLADLRECHERPGGLTSLKLPIIISNKVGDALDANPAGANEKTAEGEVSKNAKLPTSKEQQTQPQSSATTSTDHTTALQLPPDKIYHFFASHRVLVFLSVFWFVCM
jgi:hypothetical protein